LLSSAAVYDALVARGIEFFTGVPDSLLKEFCGYVDRATERSRHIIAANEGNAIALASGYHLATGESALVYMQNSGLGNAVNPLTSLADPEVYSIPMLLVVGWRGAPGRKDEPQHVKQGRITPDLLDLLGVPTRVLPDSMEAAIAVLDDVLGAMRAGSRPVALLVEDGTFEPEPEEAGEADGLPLTREGALRALLPALGPQDVVVSTTGKTSREASVTDSTRCVITSAMASVAYARDSSVERTDQKDSTAWANASIPVGAAMAAGAFSESAGSTTLYSGSPQG
jgi:phosphonopyruvate decarboxylase